LHNPFPKPNEVWVIDLTQIKLGYGRKQTKAWLCNIVDFCSKYAWGLVIPNKEPDQVLHCLSEAIKLNKGKHPGCIKSDNGGEFSNKLVKAWAKKNNIDW